MKLAGIKHKNQTTDRIYWFSVPDSISKNVHFGSSVLIETLNKNRIGSGTVVAVMDGCNEDKSRQFLSINTPFKDIIGVKDYVKIDEIIIPMEFMKYVPSGKKIRNRMIEINKSGEFNTRVAVDCNLNLIDGYTAYLVSKMFDREYIKCWRMAEVNNE